MKIYSLAFPIPKGHESLHFISSIMLSKHKTGRWKTCYNGYGGKVKDGELPQTSIKREFSKDTGLDFEGYYFRQTGIIEFIHPDYPFLDSRIYVSTIDLHRDDLERVKKKNENTKWFQVHEIPYAFMPTHDHLWLPMILLKYNIRVEIILREDYTPHKVKYKKVVSWEDEDEESDTA